MNKETKNIYNFIENDETTQNKIIELKKKYTNFKDFFNQFGYLIMDVLNNNKQFFDYNRSKVELESLAKIYF